MIRKRFLKTFFAAASGRGEEISDHKKLTNNSSSLSDTANDISIFINTWDKVVLINDFFVYCYFSLSFKQKVVTFEKNGIKTWDEVRTSWGDWITLSGTRGDARSS